uniref:Putative secreted protein n=1 Tax=Amblyomma triste TaxID=251400 RepID=A0A023G1J6_AMBTT
MKTATLFCPFAIITTLLPVATTVKTKFLGDMYPRHRHCIEPIYNLVPERESGRYAAIHQLNFRRKQLQRNFQTIVEPSLFGRPVSSGVTQKNTVNRRPGRRLCTL